MQSLGATHEYIPGVGVDCWELAHALARKQELLMRAHDLELHCGLGLTLSQRGKLHTQLHGAMGWYNPAVLLHSWRLLSGNHSGGLWFRCCRLASFLALCILQSSSSLSLRSNCRQLLLGGSRHHIQDLKELDGSAIGAVAWFAMHLIGAGSRDGVLVWRWKHRGR